MGTQRREEVGRGGGHQVSPRKEMSKIVLLSRLVCSGINAKNTRFISASKGQEGALQQVTYGRGPRFRAGQRDVCSLSRAFFDVS